MMNFNFLESSAGRIAARIQSIGVSFDPEVLSLPGGSVIAVCLWLYASTALTLKRGAARKRPVIEPVPVPAPVPACAGCLGRH
jgi:hypothetical protein